MTAPSPAQTPEEVATFAPCGTCGMPCAPGEFHPYAACLMFCGDGSAVVVRANLAAVVEYGAQAERERIANELRSDAAGAPAGGVVRRRLLALADRLSPAPEGER